jgi:hypothetical protein
MNNNQHDARFIRSKTHFMLGLPCVSKYMNNNQHDALFIFNVLSYHTSACFGRISSPSSGGKTYIFGTWYMLYCTVDCHRAWPGPMTVNSEL